MAKRPKTVMLTLRIPTSLRSKLRDAAKSDHRSVNGLVVLLLEKELRLLGPAPSDPGRGPT
jgi:hypothetical protein